MDQHSKKKSLSAKSSFGLGVPAAAFTRNHHDIVSQRRADKLSHESIVGYTVDVQHLQMFKNKI